MKYILVALGLSWTANAGLGDHTKHGGFGDDSSLCNYDTINPEDYKDADDLQIQDYDTGVDQLTAKAIKIFNMWDIDNSQ